MCRNVMNRAKNITCKPTVFLGKWDQLILGCHIEAEVSFWILIAILFPNHWFTTAVPPLSILRYYSCPFPDLTGEDDVTPGSSFVFSCLEVCLAIIVRHIPSINSALVSSGIYQTAALLKHSNEKEMNEVVSSVLNVIAELPHLCSQNGELFAAGKRMWSKMVKQFFEFFWDACRVCCKTKEFKWMCIVLSNYEHLKKCCSHFLMAWMTWEIGLLKPYYQTLFSLAWKPVVTGYL